MKFRNEEKKFMFGNKYAGRPQFENDDEIIKSFAEYATLDEKLKNRIKELKRME